ncbi:MAG: hypothetical protein ACRDYZ_13125 [Acidimicrobiales bacterium]
MAPAGDGKIVWFTLAPSSGTERAELDPTSAMDLGAWAVPGAGRSTASPSGTALSGGTAPTGVTAPVEVHIDGLPLAVYLESEQHNDALLRELTLILESAAAPAATYELPRRLVELAGEVRAAFGPATSGVRAQVDQALARGQATVDLVATIPAGAWEMLLRLSEQLDEVDRFCAEKEMLTLASSPTVRRFRRWYTRQVADQAAGGPPVPWPYAAPS